MLPSRGLILVRPVESAECFAGGRIIIPVDKRERLTANQYDVVAVGDWAICDDEDCERPHDYEPTVCDCPPNYLGPCATPSVRLHPHPTCVGDWILCAPRSAIDGPDPERSERFVHQDAVLGIFNSTEE